MKIKKIATKLTLGALALLPLAGLTSMQQQPAAPVAAEVRAAVADTAVVADTMAEETASKGDSIVQTALKYLGARYRSGHSGPRAFDCSGFTSYVYRQENIPITRSSRSQYREGERVESIADLQKGDLVFFGGSRSTRSVGHVGIVTDVDADGGRFKFIHASRRGVVIDKSTSPYYQRRYLGARRIVDSE